MGTTIELVSRFIRSARKERDLSQDQLAKKLGVHRNQIAHLEQGRRIPPRTTFEGLESELGLPHWLWTPLHEDGAETLVRFESILSEMVGRSVSLEDHDAAAREVAIAGVDELFKLSHTTSQALDRFRSILVFYKISPLAKSFFERYLGVSAFQSLDRFEDCVHAYQTDAIRLFPSFAQAFSELNDESLLGSKIHLLLRKDLEPYRERTEWTCIEGIDDDRLPDLGYISAAKYKREEAQRRRLADFLTELAQAIETRGKTALEEYPVKRRRALGALLRELNSTLVHDLMSPLFAADADEIRREAERLAPKVSADLARMEETQSIGLRNLSRYMSADYMDVYVATSMRSDADFVSVNAFVSSLFSHSEIRPLRLRYFNPTQSWIEDRVAKGLVEALMLRRASVTIYMAQKSDTFGKDSEASVALGQGKPVLVYVPKLYVDSLDLDSEALSSLDEASLRKRLADAGQEEPDEGADRQALVSQLISWHLGSLSAASLAKCVRGHWADFDLYGEAHRIESADERALYRAWLDQTIKEQRDAEPGAVVRSHLVGILVAASVNFENRARVFREVHPLALQVILSSGVLNGILVVRSVDSCARILASVIANAIDVELDEDSHNYRLVERSTKSTVRVISKNPLIGNAFAAFYKLDSVTGGAKRAF